MCYIKSLPWKSTVTRYSYFYELMLCNAIMILDNRLSVIPSNFYLRYDLWHKILALCDLKYLLLSILTKEKEELDKMTRKKVNASERADMSSSMYNHKVSTTNMHKKVFNVHIIHCVCRSSHTYTCYVYMNIDFFLFLTKSTLYVFQFLIIRGY